MCAVIVFRQWATQQFKMILYNLQYGGINPSRLTDIFVKICGNLTLTEIFCHIDNPNSIHKTTLYQGTHSKATIDSDLSYG